MHKIDSFYTTPPYNDLIKLYEISFTDNFTLPALTDYPTGITWTYGEFAERIARMHLFFELAGVRPGDHIALMGRNSPQWVATFMSTVIYGATIVPVLNDFNPADATNILNHSDAVMLFADDSIINKLDFELLPQLRCIISLDSRKVAVEREKAPDSMLATGSIAYLLDHLDEHMATRYPAGFSRNDIHYHSQPGDNVCIINYTSGTTGFSKGVMLTYDNVRGNCVFGIRTRLHFQGSRSLAMLPLAHAYGCAFDMMMPLTTGTHITLLGRTPTPAILLKALAEVKPSLLICVPLILEKIYRKMIVPMITKKPLRWVLAVPMVDKALYAIIRSKLVEAFGGVFEEVIVGGAPLNPEVEEFLYRIKFPFTVGYGMTECGPLISYTPWREFIPGSAGRTLAGIMTSRIEAPEGSDQGEIVVKGLNVMKGYYKNPDATEAVLTEDGWLHTGDMGTLGDDGRTIFIRGRIKTMILSANGQNIYPEEIEAKLNNMPFVNESLVVDRNGILTALVYPDAEELEANGLTADDLPRILEETRHELNKLVAPYEQVKVMEVIENEFVKTPKRSIKRALYM